MVSRRTRKEGARQEILPVTNLKDGVVAWDSYDDPAMPLNFSARKKWTTVGLLAAFALMTSLATMVLFPAIPVVSREFGNDNEVVGSMVATINILGHVAGPVLWVPITEMYGRKRVLDVTNIFFCACQIVCALAPNIGSLIAFRFLGGIGGVGCMTLGGGVIVDMFGTDQRGYPMGIWTLSPLVGGLIIGLLMSGIVTDTIGWRWNFWIISIVAIPLTLLIMAMMKETHRLAIIQQKTSRLRKETGQQGLKPYYDIYGSLSKVSLFMNSLFRPIRLFVVSPIVPILSFYVALLFGVSNLLFVTIPVVFEEVYGFNSKSVGLIYISFGVGNIIGWTIIEIFSDKSIIRQAQANGGTFEAEMRLLLSIPFTAFPPVALFWYGWCISYRTHWIAPIISLMVFGIGLGGLNMPILNYVVDSYLIFAASAMSNLIVLRSIGQALLPSAGSSLYHSLGLGWGNSLLGFICLSMTLPYVLLYKYGLRLRKRQPYYMASQVNE
ncbi:putative bicyclomycin resistance protein [Xylariales sp. PMI_506]|nr:putative bicyclomycin resistance protein [Xylariales sp. PMI_506]